MFSKRKLTVLWIALSLAMFAAGSKKKPPPPPPPPPPAPAPAPEPAKPVSPTVPQFSAQPTSLQRGQSATLRWEVRGNVTSGSIDNAIGTVQKSRNRPGFPADSTTDTPTAPRPGGS